MVINPAALKVIRERSGFSQTKLAEAAGIKQAHLSLIEAGHRNPSEGVIVGLAKALDVPIPAITSTVAVAA